MKNEISVNTKQYLTTHAYSSEKKLETRANLLKKYSRLRVDIFDWAFNILQPKPEEKILDAGCGSGLFLHAFASKRLPGCLFVGLDLSPGILCAARQKLESAKIQPNLICGDISAMPLPPNSFDAVMANFMLYHVPHIPDAIQMIAKILKPNGRFFAMTTSEKSNQEIRDIHYSALSMIREVKIEPRVTSRFCLENGRALIEPLFNEVQLFTLDDALVLDDLDPFMQYYTSGTMYYGTDGPNDASMTEESWTQLQTSVATMAQKSLQQQGKLEITRTTGAFLATKSK